MAIIKCANCGKDISDKAEKCVSCGKELIKDEIIKKELKCKECGTVLSEDDKICNNCGCPVKKSKFINNKKLVIMISSIIFAILLIIGGMVTYNILTTNEKADGYYKEFRWGMTPEEVKDILGDVELIVDTDETVSTGCDDYEGEEGISALMGWSFEDKALNKISIFMMNLDADVEALYDEKMDDLFEEYTKKFKKEYGNAEEVKTSSKVTYTWNTSKSKIEVEYISVGGILNIIYTDNE